MSYRREQAASDGPTSDNTKATCVDRRVAFLLLPNELKPAILHWYFLVEFSDLVGWPDDEPDLPADLV
jgi:hypothetical protein